MCRCGLHSCVGQKYAINHLICFLSVVSTRLNWERTYSAGSGGVGYYPTLYPFDSVLTITDRATSMQANLTPSSQPAYNPSVQACDE